MTMPNRNTNRRAVSSEGEFPGAALVLSADAVILSALRTAGEGGISGRDLAHKARLSAVGLTKHVETLRRLGYQIDPGPHLGFRLLRAPDVLHADDLHA